MKGQGHRSHLIILQGSFCPREDTSRRAYSIVFDSKLVSFCGNHLQVASIFVPTVITLGLLTLLAW